MKMNRTQPGQGMVEMALTLMVLLLLIFGAICAFQIIMTRYTVTQAARAAAHQAALVGGDDGANGSVRGIATTVLDSGLTTRSQQAQITVQCATQPCRRYQMITVRIRYEDELWAPIGPFTRVEADVQATRAAEKDQQP
jgi:Flp pilus assembly protein TadG